MRKVVLDCDNTSGIPGRDIDDALALIYLYFSSEVELEAVTTSFGNGSQDEVWEATRRLSKRLGLDCPIYRGCDSTDDRSSDASVYLASILRAGRSDILVVGAASNLGGAIDSMRGMERRTPIRRPRVTMMGGTLEPLIVFGREVPELNVSSDPEGLVCVLEDGFESTFVTGNLCIDLFADRSLVEMLTSIFQSTGVGWFVEDITGWSKWYEQIYGVYGFHPWDLVAAVYLTNPEIFRTVRMTIDLDKLLESNGGLPIVTDGTKGDSRIAVVQIPVTVDANHFWDIVTSTLIHRG